MCPSPRRLRRQRRSRHPIRAHDTFDAINPFGAVEPPPSDALSPPGGVEPDLPDLGEVAAAPPSAVTSPKCWMRRWPRGRRPKATAALHSSRSRWISCRPTTPTCLRQPALAPTLGPNWNPTCSRVVNQPRRTTYLPMSQLPQGRGGCVRRSLRARAGRDACRCVGCLGRGGAGRGRVRRGGN